MKVVVLDGFLAGYGTGGLPLDPARFTVEWYDDTPPRQIAARIGDAEAVFTNRAPLTAETFAACPRLRFAGTFGTGYNMIDLEAARRAGVTVRNVPSYSTMAVAQSTISLLLSIACATPEHARYVREGRWVSPTDPQVAGRRMFELAGRTLGVIGYGEIGRAVAKTAAALGMEVLACRRRPASGDGAARMVPLGELLEKSDVVSIHCPLTDETRGMVDAEMISRMKPGAVLLNTARGAILNERDVADALDSGRLYMAGLDVLSEEPPAPGHPLAFHPRVICTPHVSWMPVETRERLLRLAAENLTRFAAQGGL